MADDDDWRYHKALQLGLTQAPPVKPDSDQRRAARPPLPSFRAAERPQPARSGAPAARAARATAIPRHNIAGQLARLAVAGLALVLAAAAGWLLHARFAPIIAPIEAVVPVTSPPVTSPPVAVAPDASSGLPAPRLPEFAPPDAGSDAMAAVTQPPAPAAAPVPVAAPRADVAAPAVPRPAAVPARPAAERATRRGRATAAAPPVQASFDCRRARSRDQQLICASPYLAALDRDVAQVYRQTVRQGGPASEYAIDRDQAVFLNRRAGCETERCLGQLYNRRRAELAINVGQ